MVKCGTPEYNFMKTVIIHDTSNMTPDMTESIFKPSRLLLIFPCYPVVIRIVFPETKFNKVIKVPCMLDMCVIHQCPDGIPHVLEFI